jgi:hypothetical protein
VQRSPSQSSSWAWWWLSCCQARSTAWRRSRQGAGCSRARPSSRQGASSASRRGPGLPGPGRPAVRERLLDGGAGERPADGSPSESPSVSRTRSRLATPSAPVDGIDRPAPEEVWGRAGCWPPGSWVGLASPWSSPGRGQSAGPGWGEGAGPVGPGLGMGAAAGAGDGGEVAIAAKRARPGPHRLIGRIEPSRCSVGGIPGPHSGSGSPSRSGCMPSGRPL